MIKSGSECLNYIRSCISTFSNNLIFCCNYLNYYQHNLLEVATVFVVVLCIRVRFTFLRSILGIGIVDRVITCNALCFTLAILCFMCCSFFVHCSVNVTVGAKEDRMMMTGMHTVVDIFCVGCGSIVGWKYVSFLFTKDLIFISLFLIFSYSDILTSTLN